MPHSAEGASSATAVAAGTEGARAAGTEGASTTKMPLKKTLFSYGFRPFFLLGALWAPLALLMLFLGLSGVAWPVDALPFFRWHGHEMLFGFVATAIAGFLLTAVPAWTGSKAVSGLPLAALATLWLAGRIAVSPLAGLQSTPAALIELLFFPALMAALGLPLLRTRNIRNYPFLLMLTALFVADLLFHALQAGWIASLSFDPLRLAADLVMLMIVIVGGRIIPAFTRNALVQARMKSSLKPRPWLERVSILAIVGVVVVDMAAQDSRAAGAVSAVAALLLGARLVGWQGMRARRMPIVFILHLGFAWLILALTLKAAWLLGGAPWAVNWLHALTAGAFGTMILAVTTRVALGHTGRPLVVHRAIVWAYGLLTLGALLRVFGGVVLPAHYLHVLACAMALWAAAFLVFLAVYLPILTGPRPDQKL